jgi:hypothetical protein
MELIHEEYSERNFWLRFILIIPVALFISALYYLYNQNIAEALALLGDTVFISALLYFIFPRKYQIYDDRLKIVLGRPFAINILFSSIKEVRHAQGSKAYVYSGVRFATSSRFVVEIQRVKGLNFIISPQNGDIFLNQLKKALKTRGIRVK